MRLHDFILTHREQSLTEWETFARSCVPASITMDMNAHEERIEVESSEASGTASRSTVDLEAEGARAAVSLLPYSFTAAWGSAIVIQPEAGSDQQLSNADCDET